MTDTMDNRPATARRRLITAATSAAAGMALPGWLALGSGDARAQQAFPSKPIKLVVGYPPGGSGDFVSRVIADGISRELGVSVVVENRPGAGGSIASDYVAKSAPDGYTLLNAGPPAVLKALYKKLAYNPETDLAPVSLVAVGPMIICVNNALPVKTLGELIAYAKANPEKLFSAASGNGSAPHIASAQFETVAGVRFTTVQFKGGNPAAVSLMSGDTQVMFATPPTVLGFIQAGRMRALALTSKNPSHATPGILGAQQAGLPGYDETFSFGLYAPGGTPQALLATVNEAVQKALARQEYRDKIASQGMDASPSKSPEEFRAQLRHDAPGQVRAVAESGAKIE